MITISISNQKGGVGKTTTSSTLGAYLVKKKKRVLIIDSDPQGNLTQSMGINPDDVKTLDLVFDGKCDLSDIIVKKTIGDLCPCSLSLSDADRRYTQYKAYNMLSSALKKVSDQYDYCVIDSPPSLGILSLNDLIASDYVVVPVNAASFSIQGIKALTEIINEIKDENPNIKISGLLITRYNKRTKLSKDVLEVLDDIAKKIDTKVFEAKIRQGVAIEVSQADEKDLFSSAPKSSVAGDYEKFCKELIKDINKNEKEKGDK